MVFPLVQTAIGHWLEHLMPLVSSLREEVESFQSPPSNIVLLHLKRTHVMPWVRTAIAAAIGTPAGSALPPMAFQEEQDSMWKQIGMKMSYNFLFWYVDARTQ